jgi:hypothetical protein
MKLAILFWIYKDIEVCVNRAEWLRRDNPGTQIYCLFGGELEDAEGFRRALSGLIDDFYIFSETWPPDRKWVHGDQMLAHWYLERGHSLEWDTIFLAQWDLALLTSVQTVCGSLKADELLLPGLRPISEIESFYNWIKPGHDRKRYEDFRRDLEESYRFPDEPLCCMFLAAALPRSFLQRYSSEVTDNGFLEYKIPIYAQIWGHGFCHDHSIKATWTHERKRGRWHRFWATVHSEKAPVRSVVVALNRLLPWGQRVFHPYHRKARIRSHRPA